MTTWDLAIYDFSCPQATLDMCRNGDGQYRQPVTLGEEFMGSLTACINDILRQRSELVSPGGSQTAGAWAAALPAVPVHSIIACRLPFTSWAPALPPAYAAPRLERYLMHMLSAAHESSQDTVTAVLLMHCHKPVMLSSGLTGSLYCPAGQQRLTFFERQALSTTLTTLQDKLNKELPSMPVACLLVPCLSQTPVLQLHDHHLTLLIHPDIGLCIWIAG